MVVNWRTGSDGRLELPPQIFVVSRHGRDFAGNAEQLINGHLRRPHGILERMRHRRP